MNEQKIWAMVGRVTTAVIIGVLTLWFVYFVLTIDTKNARHKGCEHFCGTHKVIYCEPGAELCANGKNWVAVP
jgi:hypothetical protein